MRKLRVFLCHSSDDKPAVRDLYSRLCDENIEPWLDEENLLPGQDWNEEIRKTINTTDIVIVCLTKGAVNKTGFVQKEIKFALDEADKKPEGAIFIIPVKLEECNIPERLSRWHCVNLFDDRGYQRLMKALKQRANTLKLVAPGKTGILQQVPEEEEAKHKLQQKEESTPSAKVVIKPIITTTTMPQKSEQKQVILRSKPIENLTVDEVKSMLKEKGFFDSNRNTSASGFSNDFALERNGKVVHDRTTGLRWQKYGSENYMTYAKAKNYVAQLNRDQFAGYSDWRLPTLEEAMSLMEPKKNSDNLYIDPVFDKQQQWIWTSDTYSASSVWVVYFCYGSCSDYGFSNRYYFGNSRYCVRAVR